MVPTNADIHEFGVLFVDVFHEEPGPLRTEGLGKLTAAFVGPATANAIFDALLVVGFPTARIRPQDLEIPAFGFDYVSRSTVPFSWGRKCRNVSAGERFRRN
jgi:hypothetical protein